MWSGSWMSLQQQFPLSATQTTWSVPFSESDFPAEAQWRREISEKPSASRRLSGKNPNTNSRRKWCRSNLLLPLGGNGSRGRSPHSSRSTNQRSAHDSKPLSTHHLPAQSNHRPPTDDGVSCSKTARNESSNVFT